MCRVPIILVDDTELKDREEVLSKILKDNNYNENEFYWYFERSPIPDPDSNEDYISLIDWFSGADVERFRGKLPENAIVLMDLGLELFTDDIDKNINIRIDNLLRMKGLNNSNLVKQLEGVYLIDLLMKNNHFSGLISIASKQTERITTDIKDIFETSYNRNDISIATAGHQLNSTSYIDVEKTLTKVIKEYCDFSPGDNLLWPHYTSTWFTNADTECPHDPPVEEGTYTLQVKENIRRYITNLFGFCPEHWITEDKQFLYLYKDIQSLIGAESIFQCSDLAEIDALKKLSIGNLVILLGFVTAPRSEQWLQNFRWPENAKRVSILPAQEVLKAKETVSTLIGDDGAFTLLKESTNPEIENVVIQVVLTPPFLSLVLNFNCKDQNNHGTTLLEDLIGLEIRNGGFYQALRNFLVKSSQTENGKESNVNIDLKYIDESTCVLQFKAFSPFI